MTASGELGVGRPYGLRVFSTNVPIIKRLIEDGAEILRLQVEVSPEFGFEVGVRHQIPAEVAFEEIGIVDDHAS